VGTFRFSRTASYRCASPPPLRGGRG
jgi:hypothetical protein